jgi:endoglucanase
MAPLLVKQLYAPAKNIRLFCLCVLLTGLAVCIMTTSSAKNTPTGSRSSHFPPNSTRLKVSSGSADWLTPLLKTSWEFYKNRFMEKRERVVSNNYANGTISEGQSYALLKAVWMNDASVFEHTWRWTKTNLQVRPQAGLNDHLFAWRWGQSDEPEKKVSQKVSQPDGVVYYEFATDADQDIAYALLLAGEQWNRPDYTQEALLIIQDLWQKAVVEIAGKYYLASGDYAPFYEDYLTLNPSYFAPYVYRKFAQVDTEHTAGWLALSQNIYPTLEKCTRLTAKKLPPNWCAVRWDTGDITYSDKQGEGSRDFSYDAFRVFWRMSMDAAMGSTEAKTYLKTHPYLLTYLVQKKTLPEGFTEKGLPRGKEPSGFSLSAAVAQNRWLPKQTVKTGYDLWLKPYYNPNGYWFNSYNDFLHSVIWLHLYTLSLEVKQ